MSFIKTPVTGMRDCLPADMQLRQQVMGMIRETYAKYGFTEIETPAIEHIENLSNKQGGENEKLIFKIMKRGADLARALEKGNDDLADIGLRYDLTVPLARYYANNANSLPSPFKALQIGSVWRADKPQKGRFRQFTQCDIDILGDNSIMAEIELIAATSDMLTKIFEKINIRKFTVHVSDRRILRAMAKYAGFEETDFDDVFIILDKFDKIGLDGVEAELVKNGYGAEAIARYISVFRKITDGISCREFGAALVEAGSLEEQVVEDLDTILSCVRSMVSEDVNIMFDPTLVRGMSYYTGTIFECTIDDYNFSIAGGGRYDKMIGKYSGTETCACGFSIGFERIITILKDHLKEDDEAAGDKCALLVDKGVTPEKMIEVFKRAQQLRQEGTVVIVQTMKKNMKHQINLLEANGYSRFEKIFKD